MSTMLSVDSTCFCCWSIWVVFFVSPYISCNQKCLPWGMIWVMDSIPWVRCASGNVSHFVCDRFTAEYAHFFSRHYLTTFTQLWDSNSRLFWDGNIRLHDQLDEKIKWTTASFCLILHRDLQSGHIGRVKATTNGTKYFTLDCTRDTFPLTKKPRSVFG